MIRRAVLPVIVAGALASASLIAQQPPARPMSPAGSAQAHVLGTWTKGERPAFTVGRQSYVGGYWIEVTYGRPLQRGRDVFGVGADYGKALNDVGTATLPAPPVWRAGANVSTRLKTDVTMLFGDRKVPPGEYSLFIDVQSPTSWSLIVSSWGVQQKFDPNDKAALWGAYGYTPDKDVARVPMRVDKLPFAVDQLTWLFLDMTNDSGRLALMWANTVASAQFRATAP